MACINVFNVHTATVTETSSGTAVAVPGDALDAYGTIVVSSVTGTTPSFTALIQHSADGVNDWVTVVTFTAATAATRETKVLTTTSVPRLLPYVRASYTVSGTTPSASIVINILYDRRA